jgi:hypothetical protein
MNSRITVRGYTGQHDIETFETISGVYYTGFSCGVSDDAEASPEDIARYRGRSALSPIESAALVLLRSR